MADQAWPRARLKFVTSQRRAAPHSVEEYVGLEHVDSWTGRLLDTVPSQAMTGDGVAAEPGDVLFGKLRPYLAKSWKVDRRIACSSEFAVLRPKPRLDAGFLRYVLLDTEFVDAMSAVTYGTRMPRVSPDQIGNYAIAIPGLATQRAIAAFLDRETARIDALIAKKHRLLDLLDEKRTALITRAVTRGLAPDVPIKDSGVEWLGEIPAHWEVVYAKAVFELHRGFDLPGDQRQPGNVPVVGSGGVIDTHSQAPVPGPGVVTGRYGSVGSVYFLEGDFWPLNTTLYVRRFRGNHPRYVHHLLRLLPILKYAAKSAVPGVDRKDIHAQRVSFPPVAEQQEIAAHIDSTLEQEAHFQMLVERAVSLLQEYRTALISAAVTGQIDIPDAAA